MRGARNLLLVAVGFGLPIGAFVTAHEGPDPETPATASWPIPPSPAIPASASPWTDDSVLQTLLPWACDAVEAASEARFVQRPTARFSSTEDVAAAYLRRNPAMSIESARERANQVFGTYEPERRTVHILSSRVMEAIERRRKACSVPTVGLMQVLLCHEVTHALDSERFPNLFPDERQITHWVISEGHAVAMKRRIADACGLTSAFRELLALMVGARCSDDELAIEQQVLPCPWGWGAESCFQGAWIVQAAHALGGRALVDSILRNPPAEPLPPEGRVPWLRERQATFAR